MSRTPLARYRERGLNNQGAFHAFSPEDLRRRPDFLLAYRRRFFSKIGFWRDGISKSAYLDVIVKFSSIFQQFLLIIHAFLL